jgi:hypothetical protein
MSPQFSLRNCERAGRLMTRVTGQIETLAEVSGTDRMENPSVGDVIDFQRDSQGKVTGLTLRQPGQVLPGIKQPAP